MTSKSIRPLARLIDVRKQEVERMATELAKKQVISGRFKKSIERLNALCETVGASAASSPVLALNSAYYKQTVMQIADAHRCDLSLHEADMAVTRQSFQALSIKQQVLEKVWEKQQCKLEKMAASKEQKTQDELAVQRWHRSRLAGQ